MRILGIDTATRVTGISFLCDDRFFTHLVEQKRARAEELLTEMEILFSKAQIDKKSIDAYAVCLGPGSFTGLRIGVTIAKTMAQFTDKPIVGISTLEAMAAAERFCERKCEAFAQTMIVPVIDARADRVFAAAYVMDAGDEDTIISQIVLEEGLYLEQDLCEKLSHIAISHGYSRILFTGEGIESHLRMLHVCDLKSAEAKNVFLAEAGVFRTSPVEMVCRLAMQRLHRGERDSIDSLTPNYLRRSQAEMERERRQCVQ